MPVIRRTLGPCILIAAGVCLAAGGRPSLEARAPGDKPAQRGGPSTAAPVWPLPPEQPRIRYVTSYRGTQDFHPRKSSTWKTLFFGEDDGSPRDPETLIKPYGIAVSESGRIYVTDTAARRVFVFDAERKTVTFLGDRGPSRLVKPIGVAVDGEGKVFVADGTLNRVFGYAPDGTIAIAIGHEDELDSPSGMAIDPVRRRLYVADARRHRVLVYSTTDGSALPPIGRRGGEPGEFNFPTNLFVDGEGRLYVADTLNFRIQIFDADGRFLRMFGEQGDAPGTLNRPKGVGVDSEGHVYVVDSSFNNFQIFDPTGQILLFVGVVGHEPGEFFLPAGLCIDRHDRVYVADQGNARIQVFQYLREKTR